MRHPNLTFALIAFTLLAGFVGFVAMGQRAGADPTVPPTSMSQLDAARLHAAMAEFAAIEQQAKAASAPHARIAGEILERYKIDAQEFQHGKIKVNFDTGAIDRTSKPPAIAQAKPQGARP